jgi:hypothetical protein
MTLISPGWYRPECKTSKLVRIQQNGQTSGLINLKLTGSKLSIDYDVWVQSA